MLPDSNNEKQVAEWILSTKDWFADQVYKVNQQSDINENDIDSINRQKRPDWVVTIAESSSFLVNSWLSVQPMYENGQ